MPQFSTRWMRQLYIIIMPPWTWKAGAKTNGTRGPLVPLPLYILVNREMNPSFIPPYDPSCGPLWVFSFLFACYSQQSNESFSYPSIWTMSMWSLSPIPPYDPCACPCDLSLPLSLFLSLYPTVVLIFSMQLSALRILFFSMQLSAIRIDTFHPYQCRHHCLWTHIHAHVHHVYMYLHTRLCAYSYVSWSAIFVFKSTCSRMCMNTCIYTLDIVHSSSYVSWLHQIFWPDT